MQYTTLGNTGLKVSVAGLGCGGFSRLGLPAGKTEDEAARLVREAVDLGINVLDTAPAYGTEATVGKALKSIPRDRSSSPPRPSCAARANGTRPSGWSRAWRIRCACSAPTTSTCSSCMACCRRNIAYALDTLGPALLEQKAKGKIRHIGITEQPVEDFTHEMLLRAAQ